PPLPLFPYTTLFRSHHGFFVHSIPAARTRFTSGNSPCHGKATNRYYQRSICNYLIVVRRTLEIAVSNTLERSEPLRIFGFLGVNGGEDEKAETDYKSTCAYDFQCTHYLPSL